MKAPSAPMFNEGPTTLRCVTANCSEFYNLRSRNPSISNVIQVLREIVGTTCTMEFEINYPKPFEGVYFSSKQNDNNS